MSSVPDAKEVAEPEDSTGAVSSREIPGVALLKSEFILPDYKPSVDTEYLCKQDKEMLETPAVEGGTTEEGAPSRKRAKLKLKGRNQTRPKGTRIDTGDRLCPAIVQEKECKFGDKCKFLHDKSKYMISKQADISDECYHYKTYGKCPFGITCRFANSHINAESLENLSEPDAAERRTKESMVRNVLHKDLQVKLWKRRYDFSKSDKVLEEIAPNSNTQKDRFPKIDKTKEVTNGAGDKSAAADSTGVVPTGVTEPAVVADSTVTSDGGVKTETPVNADIAQSEATINADSTIADLPTNEKKKIDFADKLYLAPLTTVGNLPFRRICKGLGADITCGEMAMCTNLLQGQQSEWALLKRHHSEDLFGVQLCGGFPDSMTRCSQLICETMDVDFIDINCGCPIDLIFNRGEGSALMGRMWKFEQVVRGMKSVMDVPLTVKLRTGIYDGKNIAHTIIPKLRELDVALTTLHGRSRMQRYTKSADWEYINYCASQACPMPLFGNGDVLSWEDANEHKESTGVSGIMIARGALIKPWLFTEIKEQRHWDISSTERLDLLKDYVNYGLEHWGSDDKGVQNTRRFLLEWLSFLYRYIPVGILERVPQRINERPPYYSGRDELETLMASPNCGDWIKISEMLLGPVEPGFTFLPKHKANAYKK